MRALPSDEEIRRVKELIYRVEESLDQLTPDEQSDITAAISAVRRSRRPTDLGMPIIGRPINPGPSMEDS